MPWRVSAGWAIDLFLGGERREHEDLELAVPADRFGEIAAALPRARLPRRHARDRRARRGIGRADGDDPPDLGPRPHGEPLAGRRLSRAVRRRRLGRPPRRVDSPPLRRADRAHARRDPLRASRGRAALQGEALARRRTRRISRRCCRAYRPSGARCSRTGSSACTRVTSGSTTFAPERSLELEPRRRRGAPRAARRPCCPRRRPRGSRGSPSP